jgi:hypothetical protein
MTAMRAHIPPTPDLQEPTPADPPYRPGDVPGPEIDPVPDDVPELPDTRPPGEVPPMPPPEVPAPGPY